ncbi:HEAT repeat domain-containing protein [Halosimplex sp. J119]
MRDPEEATDGPTDPRVHPEQSPGFGLDHAGLEDIEVSREDVTIGEATPRELAATDISTIASESAREKLDRLATGDAVERQRAALALAEEERDPAIVEALVTAGLGDEDSDVRQFAVEALAKLGGENAERAALEITDDDDPWVRAEAVVALDRLDRERYADRIEAALDDDHHAVRRNALVSIFKRRGEGALEPLLDAADDESERVREWAVHLLAGVDDDRARETLREVAADESEERIVRGTAARALEADPGRFRRQFTGALDRGDTTLPGEDHLNRQPDL